MVVKCPLEQMAEDHDRDVTIMRSLTRESADRPEMRGQNMWIAATCGYNYDESIQLLGWEFKDYLEERWGALPGRRGKRR